MLITGAALAVWGTLLPWVCYRGIGYVCFPGLGLNLAVLDSISGVQIAFMALTAGAIYYALNASQVLKKPWQIVVIAVVGGALLFLVLATGIITNAGGLKFVLGVMVTVWVTFRVNRHSTAITVSVTLLLSIFAAYNLVESFTPRSAYIYTGTTEWIGPLLLFLGSLLMLGASLSGKRLPYQDAA